MTLTAPAIRDLLKTRQHLRRAGFPPDHPAIIAIQETVAAYRQEVGLPTYLSQMLGPLATLPVGQARFYDENGRESCFQGGERIIDFLRVVQHLPWLVSTDQGERYL